MRNPEVYFLGFANQTLRRDRSSCIEGCRDRKTKKASRQREAFFI